MSTIGYNITVIVFWLTTMSWLMWAKVLPPLWMGAPPTYNSILDREAKTFTAWDLFWDGQPVGEASTSTQRLLDGVTELKTRVSFEQLPLTKLSPLRLDFLTRMLGGEEPLISTEAEAKFEIDAFGRLLAFESIFGKQLLPDPIVVLGNVSGNQLLLNVHSGDFSYRKSIYLPPDRLIGDAFAPVARLRGLRMGQTWTEPLYSPFSPPNQPVELLRATVERMEYLVWNGQGREAMLITYRSESASAGDKRGIRGQTWVGKDGLVLQQEARFGNSSLKFVRRPEQPKAEIESGRQQRMQRQARGVTVETP